MLLRITLFILTITMLVGCSHEKWALLFTPPKVPIESRNNLACLAEKNFWDTLHKGDYDNIPNVTKLLTAAYLKNPNDPILAAHLGFLHIWEITERARKSNVQPTITDQIILAKKYFSDAVELKPNDARFQGFLGDSMLVLGKIHHDEREQIRGYFQLKRSIIMWPEFNYFTAGYPMSTLPRESKHFKEGLGWQWDTLDLCTNTSIDRNNPDYRPYMYLETQKGDKRACWNSWIAPHNFEGFFLNMGDMLVKDGDWKTAIKIYNNAKLSKDYASWPYRKMLERRIEHAKENMAYFQKEQGDTPETTILFNSGRGCVACHQR